MLFHAGNQFNHVKQNEIDNANFTHGYSLIEGDALTNTLKEILYEIKLVAFLDGGFILKSTQGVNFVLKAISVWSRERNISLLIDISDLFRDYNYLYISIHIYVCVYLCNYEFMNLYI